MPVYEYRCRGSACKRLTTAVRKVDDRDNAPDCKFCGCVTRKIISLYYAHSDLTPYYDDNLQCHITGKQHRQKVMQEQGVCENYGQDWHTSARKKRK